MSVIITGITGFIGSNLARKLVDKGYDIYGLVRHVSRSELRSLEPVLESVHFVEGDLGQYHSMRCMVASIMPETIVHLGALTPVRHSYSDPYPYAKINFEGTMNVVHAVLEASPNTRVISASTAEVYGWQSHEPVAENARLNPSSPYAVSKVAADTYLQMAMKVYGLRATVMRCNNTYGRIGEKGFFVEYIISSMLTGKAVYVGAPEHIRDYMFVDDHVEAYVEALEHQEAIGEVFNVSPGNPISNIELCKRVARMTSFKGQIVEGSYPPGYPVRPSNWDTDYIVLNSEKIRSRLGWKPSLGLEEGLERVIDLLKQRLPAKETAS